MGEELSNRQKSIDAAEKREKNNKIFKILTYMIIISAIIGLMIIIKPRTNDLDAEIIASELTSKNITLYTMSWCSYCVEQKELFDEAVNNLTIIECDTENASLCERLSGIPAWVTPDNKIFLGVQEFEDLKDISDGCDYEGNCNITGSILLVDKGTIPDDAIENGGRGVNNSNNNIN